MINNKISILIPFLNEEENIPFLVNELNIFCYQNNSLLWEIVFINDGSSDNSIKILKNVSYLGCEVKIISLSKNYGSHAALRAGILNATGNYLVFMYADLQDPLEVIISLYNKVQEDDFSIVWGTRNNIPTGFFDRNFSKVYSSLMKNYAISTYPEKGFDIVMFDNKVQGCLNQNIEPNSSIFLQILSLGFSQSTVFYDKKNRKLGKSKWTLSKKIKLLVDSFVAFSYIPIRLVTTLGLFMFCIGLIFTSYLILRKLVFGDLAYGWALTGSILMMGFGVTNVSLGIIAEYLWRTMDYSRKRPVFIIDEIIELK
jgi:glycosyltransferase involved in cell wall biosynthesis